VKPVLIGIAGLSGSGKTALAHSLAGPLQAEVVTLDSYYHPQSHLRLEQRAHLNYDHPDALDWDLLVAHLDMLARGESIQEPCYLFDQHTRGAQSRPVAPQPFLILEGILTLHHSGILSRLNRKVFVDTSPEECLRRRLERDITERGRTRESVIEQYERTVWPMALEYVLPSRGRADIVVSGEEPLHRSMQTVLDSLSQQFAAAS